MLTEINSFEGSCAFNTHVKSYQVTIQSITVDIYRNIISAIKVIKNWIVVQVFQGLARDYLSRGDNQFPVGVKIEPKSGALVTNGLPGHLQFYSLKEDKLLYNVSINLCDRY